MTLVALVLIMVTPTTQPVVSWHASMEDCRRQAPIEIYHRELTGRPVERALCQPVQMPR